MSDQPPQHIAQFPSVPPPAPPQVYWPAPAPKRRSFVRRMFKGLFIAAFIFSLLLNFYLAVLLGMKLEQPFEHRTLTAGREDQVVAVYEIDGVIDEKAAEHVADLCRALTSQPNVKALVLRVNSPGGGVSASDDIHSRLARLKTDTGKKIVVSMGAVAASGGYYVSAGADEIIAEPTTVTGSIGVLMQWLVIREGLGKIGFDPITLKSSHAQGWKDELSPFEKPDERQRAHLQGILDTMQDRFEKIVRDGRGRRLKTRQAAYPLKIAEEGQTRTVEFTETEPFNGKIYLGEEAKALGLVDDIGGLDAAVERATALAGLSGPKVVRYDRRRGLMDQLFSSSAKTGVTLDAKFLDDLQTPKFMMVWKAD